MDPPQPDSPSARAPIALHALDQSQPAALSARDWLLDRFAGQGQADLGGVLLVTPGARAGRVLLALLADACQRRGLPLTPPQTATAGRLGAILADATDHSTTMEAGDMARRLAWRKALDTLDRAQAQAIAPASAARDTHAWAEDAMSASDELAGGGLRFSDLADRDLPPQEDPATWQALADAQRAYEAALADAGLHDPALHPADAANAGACSAGGRAAIVLVACFDLPPATRRLLACAPCPVYALCPLPDAQAGGVAPDGVVDEAFWDNAELALDPAHVVVARGPADQAALAVNAAAHLGTSTIGTADTALEGALRRAAADAGARVHAAWGEDLSRSGPGRLLGLIASLLAGRSFATLDALLRTPVVARAAVGAPAARRLPAAPDVYARGAQPRDAFARLPAGGPGDRIARARRAVVRARRGLFGLLDPLGGRAAPAPAWAPRIARALAALLEPSQEELGPTSLRALEAIGRALDELASIPPPLVSRPISPADAIELVLGALAGTTAPADGGGEELDLLGWLELPLDPQRGVVVLGAWGGTLPAQDTPGPFITESLRRSLGLPGADRRLARDAACMACLLAPGRTLRVVQGVLDAQHEPATPSTLLLRGSAQATAVLVRALAAPVGLPDPGPAACSFRVRRLERRDPPRAMAVTSFRDYLLSPYLYYLRHVARLTPTDPQPDAPALDRRDFGTIIHEVLRQMAADESLGELTDAHALRRAMHALLADTTEQRLGRKLSPGLLHQLDAAEKRLAAFAELEACRRRQGWRTIAAEWSPGVEPQLGDTGVVLRGTIDRVDLHEEHGLALLDYKTAARPAKPDSAHRRRDKSWKDLQLPLYEQLARPLLIEHDQGNAPRLGYISLAASETRLDLASWAEEDLLDAWACAERIAASVATGGLEQFADTGRLTRRDDPLHRLAGLGMLLDPEHLAPVPGDEP